MAVANAKQELKTVSSVKQKAHQGEDSTLQNQQAVGEALAVLLSDVFALYIKTKNYHWHMKGSHFRDYHLLLEEQATQLYGITDLIAERARKIGQPTVRSLEQMVQLKRLASSDATDLSADQMLTELHDDNQSLAAYMRTTHTLTDDANDVSTTSLLEEWIDQAEERAWFLGQTVGK
ncbi:Dps protein family starvation-inducible DNA-binding protein [Pseudomonas psychrotolerans L19]|uniref:Dps family protein n=1 Tax=Pseudomonas TaxID=286 RepID=UPI00023A12D8|nr:MULTISPECIES: DNA starvation/stationary phase protection protein [Pseudomonas]EHK71478.1 Dps protein family starvation-inducible DNA-binding protein [Pseudomonas psychrotolerans L19]MBA1180483.1 DNA starvation/stationary phase protection protein [Pseudomonas psychrotolerans]MBA1210753.1 DNA starvation/stationary phase protection protein [Pseudomonas psychrotolerans]TCQ87887.1 starvation-inducible DNA-binding protein [Pseudomonas sp. JUb52]